MSYGKQDGHLANIPGFGSQQMGNAARRQSGPRKGSPSWANNFNPSQGTPDYIRLIPGQFDAERIDETSGSVFTEQVPWFEFTEHYHGGLKKSSICSAGIFRMSKDKAKPCRGCDIYWEDWRARKAIEAEKGIKPQGPNRISFSSKYAFLVLDMGWFYKGVRLDENGRPRINQQNGQPFVDWIKYVGPHQDADFQTSGEKRQGMVQSWPVGFNQFTALSGFADVVQRHCRSCGNQNCIHTSGYACPTCNAATLQPNETSLPADKVKELVSRMVACRNCKNVAYPRAILGCQYCQNPAPATLYDVDMQVQKVKSQQSSQLIIPWMSPPRPVDPQFAELIKKAPDMVKKFSPTPYEEQVTIYGGSAPQASQQPSPYSGGYGSQAPALGQPPAPHGYGQQPAQPVSNQPWPATGYPTSNNQ